MAELDPRIEAVRVKYDLSRDDFWQIPQNKQWVCKHAALEIVATKANVEWSEPQIIQADTANGIAVMSVTGKMGSRVEWSTGEASPKNNKNAYPWAMAEKRAKDRVVLKLAGIHGLVYSEDEIAGGDEPRTAEPRTTDQRSDAGRREVTNQQQSTKPSSAEMKRKLEEVDQDLLDCHSVADVNKCAKVWASIMDRDNWPKDFRDCAAPKFQKRRDAISAEPENQIASELGGRVVDERVIRDSTGRELSNVEAA
jgi:hypothetical protein